MKTKRIFFRVMIAMIGLCQYPILVNAQNIGIGVLNPLERLQVHGTVFSDSSGFRFPDGSLQSRAYNAYESQDAGDMRWIVIMSLVNPFIPGSFTYDTLVNRVKVIDYQWGMTITAGGGGGGSQITVKNIKITKNIDASTNPLLQRTFNGQYLIEVRLYFLRPVQGQGMQLYYKVILHDCLILAFDQKQVYTGGDQYSHLDIIEFSFQEAHWIYNDGIFSNDAQYIQILK
jgi:type VI secretion system Hcp family effector